MIAHILLSFIVAMGLLVQPAWASEESQMSQEEQEWLNQATKLWKTMNPQTGRIMLPKGGASLVVPKDFYYLNPDDAQKVLVEMWGNPPGEKSLGMLFPASMTPIDDESWGVTIDYEEDGYVSDEDADEINYDELLEQMQEDTQIASEERMEAGYEAIELVGWAARPFYDQESHKLHWAKELAFGSQKTRTLNYNIRVLGRKGVLVLNFIAGMDQLDLIQTNLDTVLAMAEFDEGFRYADFNPDIDKIAAYGIGGLIAGKVLAKTGIFAGLFVLLKKFGVIIVAAVGALFAKLFKERNKAEA